MTLRHRIATCFGSHSRRVWRCLVGATWSLPLRYVTLSAQLLVMSQVPGVGVHIPTAVMFATLSAGVAVGWLLRIADNLINEYLVFEAATRLFTGERHAARSEDKRT